MTDEVTGGRADAYAAWLAPGADASVEPTLAALRELLPPPRLDHSGE